MKQKNKMKKSILLFLFVAIFAQVGNAQINVTVDTGMNWVGYMNVFDSVGAAHMFGSPWAVPDLKTVVDPGNGSMQLKPNYQAYNATDPYWSNGAIGNKMMEANTFIEDTALVGQALTFHGFVDSFDINAGYIANAFIKVLDPGNGWATVLHTTDTITGVGTFSVSDSVPNIPGLVTQYGFTIYGLNANPVDEAAFGKVLIRGNNVPPAPMINVTLQVQSPDSMPVYAFGNWNNWSWPGTPMTSIGNNTYEATIALASTQNYEYLFVNGVGTKEAMDSTAACTNMNPQFTNRIITLGSADTTVCNIWETCNTCIPVGVNDVLKENLEVIVSNQFVRLNANELNEVDGLEIFDIVGKTIYSSEGKVLTNQNISVRLTPHTMYLIRVTQGNQYHTVKSMITH